jgi:predicted transcriptional regulator
MERRPVITQQIVEMVSSGSGLTSKQIAEQLQKNEKTIKVVLHRLIQRNRISREKVPHTAKSKSGPQSVYVYKAPTV